MSSCLDNLKLWESLKRLHDQLVFQDSTNAPYPVGQIATVVCARNNHPLLDLSLAAIGCNAWELSENVECPPRQDRIHLIEPISGAPTMIVWLNPLEVLDDENYSHLGLVIDKTNILGMCITWNWDSC
jgi:hypothetical protein